LQRACSGQTTVTFYVKQTGEDTWTISSETKTASGPLPLLANNITGCEIGGRGTGSYYNGKIESLAVWDTNGLPPTPPPVPMPGQASNPTPADEATNINTKQDIMWATGSDATSHDVYFGTTNPPRFKVIRRLH